MFEFAEKMLEIGTKYDPDAKLWEGPKIKQLYNPKLSIGQVILNMQTLHGPKIAQVSLQTNKINGCEV